MKIYWLVLVICLLVVLPLISRSRNRNRKNNEQANDSNARTVEIESYRLKSLMTEIEKRFFVAIKKAVSNEYIVQPQINLASIFCKQGATHYQNELYRNIDFGIFDCDYNPLLLIEINDKSHLTKERRIRDAKVHKICSNAHIPIVTFWTSYGINQEYITKTINAVLKK